MNGHEHYAEAERLLKGVKPVAGGEGDFAVEDRRASLAAAQVHATLALAAATALGVSSDLGRRPWNEAAGEAAIAWEDAIMGDAS